MDYLAAYTHKVEKPYTPTLEQKKLAFTTQALYRKFGIDSYLVIERKRVFVVSKSFGRCSLGLEISPGITLPDILKREKLWKMKAIKEFIDTKEDKEQHENELAQESYPALNRILD